jgi:hypothetical protein
MGGPSTKYKFVPPQAESETFRMTCMPGLYRFLLTLHLDKTGIDIAPLDELVHMYAEWTRRAIPCARETHQIPSPCHVLTHPVTTGASLVDIHGDTDEHDSSGGCSEICGSISRH